MKHNSQFIWVMVVMMAILSGACSKDDSGLNLFTVEQDIEFGQARIIRNDTTLNAFATPGGYMYFYTGIIGFLENEAEFAGVMAHEMAHCDRRHSTENLTRQYGFSILLNALLGKNPGVLAEIASGLANGLSMLAFSRSNEYEADEYAVRFLYNTPYDARGLGGFFERMENHSTTPVFLRTHPSPEDRLEKIQENVYALGGKTGGYFQSRYEEFKASLPR